jgi:hypothetical protein
MRKKWLCYLIILSFSLLHPSPIEEIPHLSDSKIIEIVNTIFTDKVKSAATFLELKKWVITKCHSVIGENYKKFCTLFLLKNKSHFNYLHKYNLTKEVIVFLLQLLKNNYLPFTSTTKRLIIKSIQKLPDKEKLSILHFLSQVNTSWSLYLFITIDENSLTISRYKEKLIKNYSAIDNNKIISIFNIVPTKFKKYPLIYLFYNYEKSEKRIANDFLVNLVKSPSTHKEIYYLAWQIAIRYLPEDLLKKLITKDILQDKHIVKFILYYKKNHLLDTNYILGEKENFKKRWKDIPKRKIRNNTVLKSLLWLWATQEAEGYWDCAKNNPFHGNFNLPHFEGYEDLWYNISVTALALTSFVSCGITHQNNGLFGATVKKGLEWLLKNQSKNGLIDILETPIQILKGGYKEPISRNKHGSIRAATLYNHHTSLYALTELLLNSGDKTLLKPIKKAYRYSKKVKYPILGIPRALNLDDIGPAIFAIIPMVLLNKYKIIKDPSIYSHIKKYISLIEQKDSGRVMMYSPVPQCLGGFDSIGSLLTIKGLLNIPKNKQINKSLGILYLHPPKWQSFYTIPKFPPENIAQTFFNDDDIVNEFYWLFGTTAFKFYDNTYFLKWINKLQKLLRFHQRNFGLEFGCFDPEGPWSKVGGKVYMTAMAILILQSPTLFKYNK